MSLLVLLAGGEFKAQTADVGAYKRALRADPCCYCPRTSDALDHIDAQSAGGENPWPNRVGICRYCNSGKGTKSVLAWLGYTYPGGPRDQLIAAQAVASAWNGVGR